MAPVGAKILCLVEKVFDCSAKQASRCFVKSERFVKDKTSWSRESLQRHLCFWQLSVIKFENTINLGKEEEGERVYRAVR